MASPTVTSARSGPAYSRTMASCTMVSSRWVAGLSTGSRPLSATMTMRREPRANSRCGVATDPGSARVARTMAGRFDEWAVADSARMVTSSAGSANAPMVTARLDPIPPKAVPASRPANASRVDPTSKR